MSPRTLTSLFLLTQFVLLVIVYAGIMALRSGEKNYSMFSDTPRLATKNLPSLVLGFAFITLVCLAYSQGFYLVSRLTIADIGLPVLARTNAFLVVFVLDIVGTGLLMGSTGGSKESPFSSVLFTLPAISIFLRETPLRFFIYTGLAIALFLILQQPRESGRAMLGNPRRMVAFQIVTLGSLAVISLIGYATRPPL